MTAPLRIGIVSAGELYGGVERFISTFSAYLLGNRDAESVVFLFSDKELARDLRAAGVTVAVSPYSFKFDPRQVWWLAGEIAARHITVLHAHGYKAGVIAGLAAVRSSIPAVKTEHGALEPFKGLARFKMQAYLALDRWLTKKVFDEIVYITRDLQSQRGWRGRRGARVIANGIAPVPNRNGLSRDEAFAPGKFHVGIVGRLSPVKGHSILFKALSRAQRRDNIRLHVFGDGPLRGELQAAAAAAGIDVLFHGFRRDIDRLMPQLEALAMPSLHEGLPYTLLEAMHLGLPIVASRVGGMREILSDDVSALLFGPGDVAALANQLDRLVEDEGLRLRIGQGARDTARAKYEIGPMVESYLELYREVCS